MNGKHWEKLYQLGDTRWEKGAPAPGLVDFLRRHRDLPRGTVLVPGCGTGHDVRAFAAAGFEATGLDFAPSAVALARERTRSAGLSARFHLGNFLHSASLRRFDWLFEHTLFCAIWPGDRDAYARAVLRWLRPGGQFLAIHYLIPTEGNEPPFGVTRQEVWERFSSHFSLVREWTPRSYPNRVGLEWMLWWRRKAERKSPRSAILSRPIGDSVCPIPPLTTQGSALRIESRAGWSQAPRARY